jgi:maleate isomerase
MAPPGVQLMLTSLGIEATTGLTYEQAIANLETPVKRLVARKPDAMIQTGVPPIVTQGWGIEEELRRRVAEVTDVPYISDVAASIAAMKAVGIKRVVVVSGFADAVVELIGAYLGHAGISVVGQGSVPGEPSSMPLENVYRAARQAYLPTAGDADGIWITQASVPSVGAIADLEQDLQVPVVSSAQALMWAGLRLAGVHEPAIGFGRLFDVQQLDY